MDSIESSGHPLGFPLDGMQAAPIFSGGSGEAVVITEGVRFSHGGFAVGTDFITC